MADAELFIWLADAHREFTSHARYDLDHSEATLRAYVDAFANFRHFLAAERDAGRVVADALLRIENWVRWNRERTLSRVSTNTFFRMLRPFFRFLEAKHGLPDPFRGVKAPGIGDHTPKARSADDCRRILAAAAGHAWASPFQRTRAVAIFSLFIFGGLRRNEVVRLTVGDVNLEEGTVRLVGAKGRNGGKDRTIYINDSLRNALRDYLHERKQARIVTFELFASLRTGRGLTPAGVRQIARVVRAASGISFSLHSLRHAHVVLLLQNGTPLHVVKELVGHRQLSTTAGYLRVWDEEKRAHIQRLRL
jgi:Site-specific recombinase XerD